MAEVISKTTYKVLKPFPHIFLKYLKLLYKIRRFQKAARKGHINFNRYHAMYSNHILFIAGLPKSGTSWLEKMLSTYKGYTIIPDPDITEWDYKNGGTHNFELSTSFFTRLKGTLSLTKIHCHGSVNNIKILKEVGIPYCIVYRDLRDAAVSYIFYVKRTPWHPEYPVYKKLTVQEGLLHFGYTLLPEWRNWVESWQKNREVKNSIMFKYEDLLINPIDTFNKVVDLFDLPKDNIQHIIESHQFDKMKNNGSFFRKGKSGDWKNHFDEDIKALYKEKISDFLIAERYEKNENW